MAFYVVGPSFIYYTTEDSGRKRIAGLCWCLCFCIIGAIIATALWIHYEISTAETLIELKMIRNNLVELPLRQDGVDELQRNPNLYNGKIILLRGVYLNPSMIVDTDFYQSFNCAKLERSNQYCQWDEIKLTTSTVVGKNPDGSDLVQNIVRYDHSIDWRNYQIYSALFIDRTSTYTNPIITTLPEKKFIGTTAIGTKNYTYPLLVSADNLKLQSTQKVILPALDTSAPATYSFNFRYQDQYYYYSQFYAGFSTACTAGSAGAVRISYQSQAYYSEMSMIGKLNGFTLNKVENLFLSLPGYVESYDLINDKENEATNQRLVARIFAIIFYCFIGSLIACYFTSRTCHMRETGRPCMEC